MGSQSSGLLACFGDAVQIRLGGMIPFNLRLNQRDQVQDHRELIVEVVRQTTGQPTSKLHVLRPLQFSLQLALRGHVENQRIDADNFIMASARLNQYQTGSFTPVARPQA